jgi:hypothetical protein
VSQFEFVENTPKALANLSPGLERSDNPGRKVITFVLTLKGLFPHTPNAFSVNLVFYVHDPGLSLRSNPGLKLANAFGVFSANFKLRHYPEASFFAPRHPFRYTLSLSSGFLRRW